MEWWVEIRAEVIATVIGIAVIALRRVVDRWLPDPEDKHPLHKAGSGRDEHDTSP